MNLKKRTNICPKKVNIFSFTKNSALTISIINLSPISNQILLQHLKATKSDTFWHRAWQVTFTEKCIQKWWEKKIVKRMCDKLGPQFPVHCRTSKCRKYLCEKKMMMQKYFFKASKKMCFGKKMVYISQHGNLAIFLPLRIYVKSIFESTEGPKNCHFNNFWGFDIWFFFWEFCIW